MNRYYLEYLLKQNNTSIQELGEKLNLSYQCIKLKVNGTNEFKLSEIRKIISLFNLSEEDVMKTFFNDLKVN